MKSGLATLLLLALLSPGAPALADRKAPRAEPGPPLLLGSTRKGVVTRRAMAIGYWDAPQKITGEVDGKAMTAPVLVYLPAGYDAAATRKPPLVIALHGWNHTPEQVRDKADLEILADRYGLVIAVPAMGKTIYETSFFAETKQPWAAIPGARWVGEVVLPQLRARYAVAGDRAHTAVIGYAMGGRGAVLLAQRYPEFAFAGSLSGTFDLLALAPRDAEYKLHAAVYGSRRKFEQRWAQEGCVAPERLAKLADTALFLGHGGEDAVVAPAQLDALTQALTEARTEARTEDSGKPKGKVASKSRRPRPSVEVVLAPDGGHDWGYWNSQWPAMFQALTRSLSAAEPEAPRSGDNAAMAPSPRDPRK